MSIKSKVSDYSPQIFMTLGIIGFIGTTVTAVMKADKVKPIVKKAKEDLKESPKPGSKSRVEVIGKAVIDISREMELPICIGAISLGCFLKSYEKLNGKYLSAVGVIHAVKSDSDIFKKATLEEVGDKVESDLGVNPRAESFTRYFSKETSKKYPTGGADTVLPFLKSQETYFNQLLHSRERFGRPGVVRFNEVLEALGFDKIPEGETAGWISRHGEGFIDFGIFGAYYADPDGVLDRYNSVNNADKIPRSDSGYMLMFNVDPFVIR